MKTVKLHKMPGLVLALAIVLPSFAHAQLWNIRPDVSFSTGGMDWTPVDTVISAVGFYGAREGGYLKLGYGLAFDQNYYFLLPELESAMWANAGLDMLAGKPSGFTPGGAAEADGPARDYKRVYGDLGLQQVLLGDRRHANSWLMLSLSEVSRYVMPAASGAETAAPAAFFTHAPGAELSFNLGSRKSFMEVLSLSGGAGVTLEAGHGEGRDPWAFLMSGARLGFKVPIAGKYLYLDASASLSALVANYTPAAAIPAWSYTDYSSQAECSGGIDLKSRIFQFDPLVTIAIEPGIGVGGSFGAASVFGLNPLEFKPKLRAFVDIALDASPQYALRVRLGATYDPETREFGFLFSTR